MPGAKSYVGYHAPSFPILIRRGNGFFAAVRFNDLVALVFESLTRERLARLRRPVQRRRFPTSIPRYAGKRDRQFYNRRQQLSFPRLQMTPLSSQLAANRESVPATPHGAATADFDRCRIQPAFYLKPAGELSVCKSESQMPQPRPRPARSRRSRGHPVPARGPPLLSPDFPVVGIGASAGGLEACTELFRALPPDNGWHSSSCSISTPVMKA